MRLFGMLKCVAVCLTLAGVARVAPAAFLTDLHNTGVNDGGSLLANGVTDSHYSVTRTSSALVGIKNVTVAVSGFPFPYWAPNDSDSQWLGVATGAATEADPLVDSIAEGNGIYEWTIHFDVPDFADLSTISITGLWGSDNPGLDILLGNSLGIQSTGNTSDGYGVPLDAFAIGSILGDVFAYGDNWLTFKIQNTAQDGGNPTGLRVDNMLATYDVLPIGAVVPEASSFLVIGLGGIFAFGAIGLGKRYGISAKL